MANSGDAVILLSSDLIATVMQRYFREEMFKLPVTVVDLSATEAGYAFNISFGCPTDPITEPVYDTTPSIAQQKKIRPIKKKVS